MSERHELIARFGPVVALTVIGIVVFISGLRNAFQGDDLYQITQNPLVHSLAHIGGFFNGGTFYNGQDRLGGVYYRPLIPATYALMWAMSGGKPFIFHFVQMVVCIANAFLIFRFFKYSFRPLVALILATVFLVHPANSQVAFAIPYWQDAVFFLFGMAGLYVVLRYKGIRSVLASGFLLGVSVFFKETGFLFIVMTLIYLLWWDRRRRFFTLLGFLVIPLVIYSVLRIASVGFDNPHAGPIDDMGLGDRVLTVPSLLWFYISKFVWPFPLSSGYYWTYRDLSLVGNLLAFAGDVLVIALMVYVGRLIAKHGTRPQSRTYRFFAVWLALGILIHIQFVPLDESASETYLYFPMVGMLGMVGLTYASLWPLVRIELTGKRILAGCLASLVLVLGVRTIVRGTEWSDPVTLAQHDLATSPTNYQAEVALVIPAIHAGDFDAAIGHGRRAVAVYPSSVSYKVLGLAYLEQQQYSESKKAFAAALVRSDAFDIYEDFALAAIYDSSGDATSDRTILLRGLQLFPNDGKLWLYIAILDENHGDNEDAKTAITNAYQLGAANIITYNAVMSSQFLQLPPSPGLDG